VVSDSDKPTRRGLRARLRGLVRRATAGERAAPRGPAQISFGSQPAVEVPHGTTVLHAATRNNVDISHYCGGMASCGTCRISIAEGADNLSPIEGRELMVLGNEAATAGDRLACQARIQGTVAVKVPRWF